MLALFYLLVTIQIIFLIRNVGLYKYILNKDEKFLTSLFPYILASSVSLAICASSGLTLTRGTFSEVVGGPLLFNLRLDVLNGINIGNGFFGLGETTGAWHSAK